MPYKLKLYFLACEGKSGRDDQGLQLGTARLLAHMSRSYCTYPKISLVMIGKSLHFYHGSPLKHTRNYNETRKIDIPESFA
jgi:hypothetical protein